MFQRLWLALKSFHTFLESVLESVLESRQWADDLIDKKIKKVFNSSQTFVFVLMKTKS